MMEDLLEREVRVTKMEKESGRERWSERKGEREGERVKGREGMTDRRKM